MFIFCITFGISECFFYLHYVYFLCTVCPAFAPCLFCTICICAPCPCCGMHWNLSMESIKLILILNAKHDSDEMILCFSAWHVKFASNDPYLVSLPKEKLVPMSAHRSMRNRLQGLSWWVISYFSDSNIQICWTKCVVCSKLAWLLICIDMEVFRKIKSETTFL